MFLGNIYVGEDPDNPLSIADKHRLDALGLSIIYVNWGKVTGYGETTILSELKAFRAVADSVPADNWIAKIDSDVLFLNDKIFDHVCQSKADFIGQLEDAWRTFTYSQGGCYFVRAGFVSRWDSVTKDDVDSIAMQLLERFRRIGRPKSKSEMSQCPEDVYFHHIAKNNGGRIELLQYYLPLWHFDRFALDGRRFCLEKPTFIQAIMSPRMALGVWMHDFRLRCGRYSVLHFTGCKERMQEISRLIDSITINDPDF